MILCQPFVLWQTFVIQAKFLSSAIKKTSLFLSQKNGSGHLVVMSMDTYEKQLGILDVYRKLGAAEKQLEDGVPLLDGDEVIKRLREKHGK